MSGYSVAVYVSYATGATRGRQLAPTPGDRRTEPTIRAIRAWLDLMRPTWLGALDVGEPGFIALVLDDEGEPARTFEYGRDPDAEPIEHGRASLRAMQTTTATSTPNETDEGATT
jgi:hypothetical protein